MFILVHEVMLLKSQIRGIFWVEKFKKYFVQSIYHFLFLNDYTRLVAFITDAIINI